MDVSERLSKLNTALNTAYTLITSIVGLPSKDGLGVTAGHIDGQPIFLVRDFVMFARRDRHAAMGTV